MYKGWVSIYRELIEKPIWLESTPEQKTILMAILLMANYSENSWVWKGEKYTVKPGQFISSLPKIAESCGKGISIQNVRTALKRFEKLEFLTDESTKQNRLITVVNWGLYQNDKENQQDSQQTANRQLTANNKENKSNKNNIVDLADKKTEKISSSKNQINEFYERVWKFYPRREGKKITDATKKKLFEDVGEERLLKAIKNYAEIVKGKDKQYILMGSTFFNGRYEDYLDETLKEVQAENTQTKRHEFI